MILTTHNNNKVREMPSCISQNDKDRFWTKVSITANPKTCWEWQNFNNKGYGTFKLGSGIYYTHRVAYFFHHKIDPLDKQVCHSCDNRKCCNPSHLFLGSNLENYIDSVKKGRGVLISGEDNYTAKLTESQALSIIKECRDSNISYAELGKKYNVAAVTIFAIIHKKTWKHLKGDRGKYNHPLPFGENHKISKLTESQVVDIRRIYSLGTHTGEQLATLFNVSRVTISNVIQNKIWRHLLSEKEAELKGSPYNRNNRPNSKFNDSLVSVIREEYKTGGTSSIKLAAKYSVTKKAILDIIHFRTWKAQDKKETA